MTCVVTTPSRYPEAWRSLGWVLTPRDGIPLEEAAAFVEAYRPPAVDLWFHA